MGTLWENLMLPGETRGMQLSEKMISELDGERKAVRVP